MYNLFSLIDRLAEEHSLSKEQYEALIAGRSQSLADYARKEPIKSDGKYIITTYTSAALLK